MLSMYSSKTCGAITALKNLESEMQLEKVIA
jgi:hypothetical protein